MAAIRGVASVAVLILTMAACSSALHLTPAAPTAAPEALPSGPSAAGGYTRTVSVADATGGTRDAIVHRPDGLGRGTPLVVVLHGAFGSAEATRAATGWDALADREGFLVAYPSGSGRTWNAGLCCGPAHARNVDDVDFLHRLVERLVEAEGVDRHRVYAVGMSNGAMMAYAWACQRPDDLAGIGPVAGALVSECAPSSPVNVVALHGTADRNVPIAGGIGPRSVTRYDYPSLANTLSPFLAADKCTPAPRRNDRGPLHISTFNCVGGAGVTVAVVDGLGHEWPGAKHADPVRKLLQDKVAPPLDATAFLWSHLRGSTATS
jgi:polyhydroxybutyrate depolymerase